MSILLGDTAPNFQHFVTTEGDIADFHRWNGVSWCILFSHPKDFTPVCTTELGATAKLKDEFARRNVKVLAVSVDALDSHSLWVNDINETQNTSVDFPVPIKPRTTSTSGPCRGSRYRSASSRYRLASATAVRLWGSSSCCARSAATLARTQAR